jgi:hypothetical protein
MHMKQLVSKMLPLLHQLNPLFGSYYLNTSGLFCSNIWCYNLSFIPHDTSMTWKLITDHVMENTNLSAILERLWSWNWSGTDMVWIKVNDQMVNMANVLESVVGFQVFHPHFHYLWLHMNHECYTCLAMRFSIHKT